MRTESQGVTASPDPQPCCPACHTPGPDWAICPRCRDNVDRWLGEILMLHELVRCAPLDYLLPASGGGGDLGSIKRDPPLPLDLAALDLLTAESVLRGMDADDMGLEDWTVDWRHWLGHSGHGAATERDRSPAETLSGVIRYLRANWPLMARAATAGGHPAADEFADDVRRIRNRAWAALRLTPYDLDPDPDAKPPADWTIRCPNTLPDGRTCGHRIGMRRGLRPIDNRPPDPVAVTCEACRRHWDGPWLLRVAIDAGMDVAMGLHEVMGFYGCTERTIRRKVAAGVLIHERGRYRVARTEATG